MSFRTLYGMLDRKNRKGLIAKLKPAQFRSERETAGERSGEGRRGEERKAEERRVEERRGRGREGEGRREEDSKREERHRGECTGPLCMNTDVDKRPRAVYST